MTHILVQRSYNATHTQQTTTLTCNFVKFLQKIHQFNHNFCSFPQNISFCSDGNLRSEPSRKIQCQQCVCVWWWGDTRIFFLFSYAACVTSHSNHYFICFNFSIHFHAPLLSRRDLASVLLLVASVTFPSNWHIYFFRIAKSF